MARIELTITSDMRKNISEKEQHVKKLNDLCNQLVALEIKEKNMRAKILDELTNSEEKLTEKVKVAKADKILKSEMGKIAHLKNNIAKEKREIELCNDKISLCRNMIREMQILATVMED